MLGVEQRIERLVFTHKLLDRFVVFHHAHVHGVGGNEAIERGDDREQHVRIFSNAECDYRVVVCFLSGLSEEHDPACIASTHNVGMIAMDVDRSRDGAVRVSHDDRATHTGSDVEFLPHVGQTLRAGCGCNTCTCSRSADASRKC